MKGNFWSGEILVMQYLTCFIAWGLRVWGNDALLETGQVDGEVHGDVHP